MLVRDNLTASIIVGIYFAIYLVAIPLWLGLVSRTARRTTFLSTLCGLIGAMLIVGLALLLRGTRGLPPAQVAIALLGLSAATTSIVGWLTFRLSALYREHPPIVATGKASRFLFMVMIKVALFYLVLNAIWIVGAIDLADEIPQLMFQYLHPVQYVNVGAAIVVVFAWVLICVRRNRNAMWLAIVQVIPATVAILLLLPVLLAQLQTAWSTPLLDCSPKAIPGYVPDMIDYTRFVLNALGGGALFDWESNIGRPSAICAPFATSHVASGLAFALNLAPVSILALLAYRFFRLRSDIDGAGRSGPR